MNGAGLPSDDLKSAVAHWATPRREDAESCGNHPGANDSLTGMMRNWPTPAARDYKGTNSPEHEGHGDQLPNFVAKNWPTPNTTDGKDAARHTTNGAMHPGTTLTDSIRQWPTPEVPNGGRSERPDAVAAGKKTQIGLHNVAAQWQTPTASAATDGNASRGGDRKDEKLLAGQARAMYPTPSATQYGSSQNGINGKGGEFERPSASTPSLESLARSGALPSRPDPETPMAGARTSPSTLVLNPQFVEALMGWPIGWTDCGSAATASSPSKPRSRGSRSKRG